MDTAGLAATGVPLFSALIALAAAWWNKQSAAQGAEATLLAGHSQGEASLEATRSQGRGEIEQWARAELTSACTELLRTAALLTRTVKQLPNVPHEQRHALLAPHAEAVEAAYAPFDVLAPAALREGASRLRDYCMYLERLAMNRAVLRSAVEALHEGMCHGDVENCTNDRHGSSFVAWELLGRTHSLKSDVRSSDATHSSRDTGTTTS
ncbi:hypothetical protein [Streptomyces melanogenes]|uniref:hypothetical protein n=1 Tax=Streptomyces melanogenes TaxID=67326 RepID=UPI0037BC135E